jgi:hypothetical protein
LIENGFTKSEKKLKRRIEKIKQKPIPFNYVLEIATVTRIGEELCDECKGSGIDPERRISKYRTKYRRKYSKILKTSIPICRRCDGKGKMDWITKIKGR